MTESDYNNDERFEDDHQGDDRLRCVDCNALLDGSNSPEDADACFACLTDRADYAADRAADYKTWLEARADYYDARHEDTPALNEEQIPPTEY